MLKTWNALAKMDEKWKRKWQNQDFRGRCHPYDLCCSYNSSARDFILVRYNHHNFHLNLTVSADCYAYGACCVYLAPAKRGKCGFRTRSFPLIQFV